MTTNPYAEEVSLGAALMDEKFPDWFDIIDPNQLTMSSCTKCIIGTVMLTTHPGEIGQDGPYYYEYQVYERGLELLGLADIEERYESEVSDEAHGFNLYPYWDDEEEGFLEPTNEQWQQLGEAWKQEILARKERAA